ncbi:MAG TPA: hypothetical protein VK391_01185 [Allosphingosinicella sp.]|nr:hypothetical protein [Allosphingosinicella sp.]
MASGASKGGGGASNPPAVKLRGSAYVQQIGGSLTDPSAWMKASSLIPSGYSSPSLDLIIADKGNAAHQTQVGTHRAFTFQWGTSNSAAQQQSGSGNVGEIVQISPGAMTSGGANAGGGNGGEFDIFGFEVDPGNSGPHNRAKEPEGAGSSFGKGNTASQSQTGTGNLARALQIGWSNKIVQSQSGSGHQSIVVQIGQLHDAVVRQSGVGNVSNVIQTGIANSADVRQSSQ